MKPYTYKGVVTRVVDGDTVDVDVDLGFDVWLKKQRVRLAGIDTPESRTRNLAEKALGLAAKARERRRIIVPGGPYLGPALDQNETRITGNLRTRIDQVFAKYY